MPVTIWHVLKQQIESLTISEEFARPGRGGFGDPLATSVNSRSFRWRNAASRRNVRRAQLRHHTRRPSPRAA